MTIEELRAAYKEARDNGHEANRTGKRGGKATIGSTSRGKSKQKQNRENRANKPIKK